MSKNRDDHIVDHGAKQQPGLLRVGKVFDARRM